MRALIAALEQMRSRLTLAIDRLERGDQEGAAEVLEQARAELREALEDAA